MASEACKELPPVTAEYNTKGSYETIAGFKTCKFSSLGPILLYLSRSTLPSLLPTI